MNRAGRSTRFKSAKTKVLHELAGRPLLEWVLRAAAELEPALCVIVHSAHNGAELEQRFGAAESARLGWRPKTAAVIDENTAAGLFKLLETLESLIDNNLLRQREQADGEPRFWMLETIREYALEKLSEEGGLKDAQLTHARFFLELAEAGRETDTKGHLYEEWLPRMDREYDNMRAALRWSLDQPPGCATFQIVSNPETQRKFVAGTNRTLRSRRSTSACAVAANLT